MPAFVADSSLTPRNDTYPFIDPAQFKGGLRGRNAVITGGGRGIGRETALAFASAGAGVALVARSADSVGRVRAEIEEKYGTPVAAVPADVTDPEAVRRIVSETERMLGLVDVLVNCAGVTRFNTFELEADDLRDWWKVMELNVHGPIMLTKTVLGGMLERRRGTIINLTSTSGAIDVDYQTAYATSKAAILKFSQGLHAEVVDRGVSVFAVHPGSVDTGMGQVDGAMNMEALEKTPGMQKMASEFQGYTYQSSQLPAHTMVWLAAAQDAKLLSGKFVDSQYDLEPMVEDLRKGEDSKIQSQDLYKMKVREL